LTFVKADAEDFGSIERAVERTNPQVVVNCIGITKHLKESNDLRLMFQLNAAFPHQLSALCERRGTRLVHISSDCVFSGVNGGYLEDDLVDATDYYGQSKALGELVNSRDITIRTSTIGHEFSSKYGLLDWFLSQGPECLGYTKARFSGVTALELGRVIATLLEKKGKPLSGLYQLSGPPIAKYDLLELVKATYQSNTYVQPDDKFVIDRTLNGALLDLELGRTPLSWSVMLHELFNVKFFWGNDDKE
jgi:dTDP-4-dehydrorhamnose reductase